MSARSSQDGVGCSPLSSSLVPDEMQAHNPGPEHERAWGQGGQSTLEYIGLLILVATAVGVIVASSAFSQLPSRISTVVCKVTGGTDCTKNAPSATRKRQRPDWLPEKCLVKTKQNKKTSGVKVVAYRHSSTEMTLVKRYSDGSIRIIRGSTSGHGVDLRAGYGVDYKGRGASITAGGGMMWNAKQARRFTFESQKQVEEFRRRINERLAGSASEIYKRGPLHATKVPNKKDIRKQLAREMGIPHSSLESNAEKAGAQVNGSYGAGSAAAGTESVDATGTWYNDRGTRRASDDVVTRTYKLSDKYTWEGGLGIPPSNRIPGLENVEAGGKYFGDYAKGGTFKVKKKNGKPVKLVLIRKRGWSHHLEGGVNAGKKTGAKGGEGNTSWNLADTGGVSIETTTIDLQKHPSALPDFRKWLELKRQGSPAGPPTNFSGPGKWRREMEWRHKWPEAKKAMAKHIRNNGRTTRVNYNQDKKKDTGATDGSLSYFLELLRLEDSRARQRTSAHDAQYRNPRTGRWKPWISCKK